MPEGDTQAVESAEQLLKYVELTSTTYFEYSGKQTAAAAADGDDDASARVRTQLLQLVRPDKLSIRLQTTVETTRGKYFVDLAANYATSTPLEIAESAMAEFINRVAMMTLWPYVRIAVQELTMRIEGRGAVLGLHAPTTLGLAEEADLDGGSGSEDEAAST